MPLEAHTFLKGRSILSYFLRLNYNFRTALKKSVKQHLLGIAIYPRKTALSTILWNQRMFPLI